MTFPKIIATDLDGTFFNDAHTFNHEKFGNLLDDLDRRGTHFIIATGNEKHVVDRKFAPFIGRFDYLVQNGGQIVTRDNVELADKAIGLEQLKIAMDVVKNIPIEYGFGNIYSTKNMGYMLAEDKGRGFKPEFALKEFKNMQYIDSLEEIPEPVLKVILSWPEDKALQVIDALNDKLRGSAHVTTSGFGYIDIVAEGVNKGEGLKVFGDYYGVSLSEMAAFGDGMNDYEMLSVVGKPIAMLNGDSRLLDKFEHSVATNDDDGVINTIATFW